MLEFRQDVPSGLFGGQQAPVYKFLTMHPRDAVRRVPLVCIFHIEVLGRGDLKEETLQVRHKDHNRRLYTACGCPGQ